MSSLWPWQFVSGPPKQVTYRCMIVHVLGRQEWLFLLHREHAAKYDPKKARSLDTIVTTHYMKGINRRDVLEKHDLLGILVVSTG